MDQKISLNYSVRVKHTGEFRKEKREATRVSVVIPTHNRAEFLLSAITSVLNQTFQDFELIVVDDFSHDHTGEIVRSFRDRRIRFFRHETQKGGAAARNTGIEKAQGQYIAFLDDDDEWLPEKLRLQVALLDNSPAEVGVVYTGHYQVDQESGEVVSQTEATKRGNLFHVLLYRNWIGTTSSVLLKKECFERVGLFDEDLQSSQDYDLWIRISKEFHFACVNKPLLRYHVHGTRITTDVEALNQGLLLMIKKHEVPSFMFRETSWYRKSLEIGTLYCLQNNLKKARRAYRQSIRLYPMGFRGYVSLCVSLCGISVFKRLRQWSNSWNSVVSEPIRRNGMMTRNPRLQLIQKLSETLNREAIRYCHWKSNEALHRSLSGDNDLDLLIDPCQRFQFSKLLVGLGFKQASKPQDARHPGIFSFYGYDKESEKVVHVHVHYRLIVGSDLIKNYELPFLHSYLDSARDCNGLMVPSVEFEYIVFVIRMTLKRRLLPWILGHPDPRDIFRAFSHTGRPGLRGAESREWSDFQFRVRREEIADLLAKYLSSVDGKLFEKCERSLQPTEKKWEWFTAGLALCSALKSFQIHSTLLAVALAVYRRVESLLPIMTRYLPFRFSQSQKRRRVSRGRVIAFVGGDGSGKSTNLKALQQWLGKTFDVKMFHLGLPPLGPVRIIFLLISKAIRLLMGNPPEIQVKPLHAITQILVARGRWKLAKKVLSASKKRVIVLCDRFPLKQLKLSEGPLIPSINNNGSTLLSWFAAIEQSYYDKIYSLGLPHDIIVLRVDPQTAIDRKPEDNSDIIRQRLQEIWNVNWNAIVNSHVIDTGQPLKKVLAQVRCVVWSQLPSWLPHIEIAGPPGAGKTTLMQELLQKGAVTSGEVSPAVHPFRVLKNAIMLWWSFFSWRFEESKWMIISTTQLDLWELRKVSCNSHLPVFYDQGPFFFNAFALRIRDGRLQSRRYRVWHKRQIDRSQQILDLIIWLEANNISLRNRINSRPVDHAIKGKPEKVQVRFLADYEKYFNSVLTDQSGNKAFSCIRFRTDDMPTSQLVGKIIEHIL